MGDVVEVQVNNDTWVFHSPADAREFLGQILRVWAAWLVMLAFLTFAAPPANWAGSLAIAVLLIVLVAPLQRRVDTTVSQDGFDDNRVSLLVGRGTRRDRALRDMLARPRAFGAALRISGADSRWVVSYYLVALVTVASAVALIVT
ncbi:MAG: hypothetical protein IIC71_00910 [Acidobacteria bacterium]|nr:hypothetical protein [Acidobacteriota bacterium]